MELSLSCSSSLHFSATLPGYKSTTNCKGLAAKPTSKLSDLLLKPSNHWHPFVLNKHLSSPKPLSNKSEKRNFVAACSRTGTAESDSIMSKTSNFIDAYWRFIRPYTIRGTVFGSISLLARASIENPHLLKLPLLLKALPGLSALVFANAFIACINQIYDIEIDKINKPYLPIAAGDISVQSAWSLVLFFAVAGLLIVGMRCGPFLTFLYSICLFLGTIYSVPPFRMKRFPIMTSLMMATVYGFLFNFGVYHAIRGLLGLPFQWSAPVAFITIFMTLFALVMTITKDLPDVEGDRKFKISTFATKLGVRNMAFLGSGLLLVTYIGAILAAIYMPQAFRRSVMISSHVILALCSIYRVLALEKANYSKEALAGFYLFIWNLFYAEYAIFPFI